MSLRVGISASNTVTVGGTGVQARMSDSFNESVIINAHLNFAGPYATSTNWIHNFLEPLANAGLRYVRSRLAGSQAFAQMATLNTLGIKALATLNSPIASVVSEIDNITSHVGPSRILAFEGLNEPNNGHPAGWESRVINHTIAVWNHIRGISAYDTKPILSYSNWGHITSYIDDILAAGWIAQCLSKIDAVNLHYYTAARRPTITGTPTLAGEGGGAGDVSLQFCIDDLQRIGPLKPMWMTECGFNYQGPRAPSPFFVTLQAQAKYVQRQFFDNLYHGLIRTAVYELLNLDDTRFYGLVETNTSPFTRRPAYDTLLRTLAVFNDPGITFTPAFLDYSLSGGGNGPRVFKLLFQKRDGTFLIPIWYDWDSYRRTAPLGNNFQNASPVVVNFGRSMSRVRTVRPYDSSVYTTVGTNVSSVSLTVPDDVLIVEARI